MTKYTEPADRTVVAIAHPLSREPEQVFRRDDSTSIDSGYGQNDDEHPTGRHWY